MGLLDRVLGKNNAPPGPEPVPATWLQRPTIMPGGRVDVVGESHYQPALENLAGGRTEDGPRICRFTAQLVREPKNRHDRNAVRVDIGGQSVGYIARGEAPLLHGLIAGLADLGLPAACQARMTGGWQRGLADRGHFGVVLGIGTPLAQCPDGLPLLPGEQPVKANSVHKHQDALMTLAATGAHQTATLSSQDRLGVDVYVDGQQIGVLGAGNARSYLPLVLEAWDAGLPPTCAATLERGSKKIEVALSMPEL